jgi:molecular chaperone GrpE
LEEHYSADRYEAYLASDNDIFLRLFAEFENYKKRTSRERMELFKTAGQEVIASLLPVLDDFDRALKEISKSSDQELFKGVELIDNKLRETLKAKGLQEIEVKEGEVFDPELHDAITQVPAPDKKLKGRVIDVIEKGFLLGDKVIRHPKVVVGN